MKSKTVGGVTRPDPTQKDCDLLDRAIDLVLLYGQYEGDEQYQTKATDTANGLRDIAWRCNAFLKDLPAEKGK